VWHKSKVCSPSHVALFWHRLETKTPHFYMVRNDLLGVRSLVQLFQRFFQNAQLTSNWMVHGRGHHFLARFLISFLEVWSVLLRVVAQKNHLLTGWDFVTANQKLLFNVFKSYHLQQNETHHVKGYGKLFQGLVSFLVYHLVWGR